MQWTQIEKDTRYKLIKETKKNCNTWRDYLRYRYYWDDAYSMYKIFDEIKNEDNNYLSVKSEIKKLINKKIIISVKKNYFSKLLVILKFCLSNLKKTN